MKAHLRLPTGDQYAYIEIETEVNSIEDAVVGYNGAMRLIKPSEGLPDKEFDAFLERQLLGEGNDVNEWEKMSPEQKKYIQANKRALNRISYKQLKENNG